MRILVADQNSLLLTAITATFGRHCDLVTATRRDACLAQVEKHRFDVVIACDKLADYTGLELLSEVPVISPDTLLIFAADPKRLNQLGKRLAVFGLFDTLTYPLTPQKLVEVLKRARESLGRRNPPPKVRHVVLESEWDTGERLGLVEQELRAEQVDGGRPATTHEEWAKASEIGAAAQSGGGQAREESDDDFVFEGPPPAVQAMAAPARADGGRSRGGEGKGPAGSLASGRTSESNAQRAGRTFEGTPVAPRGSRAGGSGASAGLWSAPGSGSGPVSGSGSDSGSCEVTAYEVKPVAPALTHDRGDADDFVFAEEPDPVAELAESLIEVEAARAAEDAGDGEPGLNEVCCNDPEFENPESPDWAEDGAANDIAFQDRPLAPASWRRGGAGGIAMAAREAQGTRYGTPALEKSGAGYAASAGREVPAGHQRNAGAAANTRALANSSQAVADAHRVGASQTTGAASSNAGNPTRQNRARSPNAADPGQVPSDLGSAQANVDRASTSADSSRSGKAAQTTKSAASAATTTAPSPNKSLQPRTRTQSVPTAAQRAAFERAMVARRNGGGPAGSSAGVADAKGRKGRERVEPTIHVFGGDQASSSLSELAKMASSKRPLATPGLGRIAVPKRAVVAVSSGLAAVLILGVLSFELLRDSREAEHHMPHARTQSTQIFSSTNTLLASRGGAAQLVAPQAPAQSSEAPQNTGPSEPQAQTFDPDTAPPDPPPPPALEHPGPMEPPSLGHTEPSEGMMPDNTTER
jgi:hypothetical protein